MVLHDVPLFKDTVFVQIIHIYNSKSIWNTNYDIYIYYKKMKHILLDIKLLTLISCYTSLWSSLNRIWIAWPPSNFWILTAGVTFKSQCSLFVTIYISLGFDWIVTRILKCINKLLLLHVDIYLLSPHPLIF